MHAQAIKHEATELIGRWLRLSYPEKPMRVSLCPCRVCVAVPRGMEELWQLCCAVHLWWLPGSVGSQWKQQSIYSNSRVSWGGDGGGGSTHMHMLFPTVYHARLGVFLLLLFLSPSLSFLTQHIISPLMTILLWVLITSLLIAPSAFLPHSPHACFVAILSVYDGACRYQLFSFRNTNDVQVLISP